MCKGVELGNKNIQTSGINASFVSVFIFYFLISTILLQIYLYILTILIFIPTLKEIRENIRKFVI